MRKITKNHVIKYVSLIFAFAIISICFHAKANAENVLVPDITWNETTKMMTISPMKIHEDNGDYGSLPIREQMMRNANSVFTHYYQTAERVEITGNYTGIPKNFFQDFTALKEISLPDTLQVIEKEAFLNCTSLQSVILPSCVTTIGEDAFKGCASLAELTIPESVKTFEGSSILDNQDVTIYGIPGSAAESYAKEKELTFSDAHVVKIVFIENFNGSTKQMGEKSILFGTSYGDLSEYALPNFASHSFEGFYTEKSGGMLLSEKAKALSMDTVYAYAHWSPKTFRVTYKNEGKILKIADVTYGESYGEFPSLVTRTGYKIAGWYATNEKGSQTKVTSSTKMAIAANHTVEAIWKRVTYEVKIVKNGGTGVSKVKFHYGDVVKAPVLKSSSMKFVGFYADKNFKKKFQFGKKLPAKNQTAYAKWIKLSSVGKPSVSSAKVSGSDLLISVKKSSNAEYYVYELSEDKDFKKKVVSIKTDKTSIKVTSKELKQPYVKNFSQQYIRVKAFLKVSDGKSTAKSAGYGKTKKTGVLKFKPVVNLKFDKKLKRYYINIQNFGYADVINMKFGTSSSPQPSSDTYATLTSDRLQEAGIKASSMKKTYVPIVYESSVKNRGFKIFYLSLAKEKQETAYSDVRKLK